MSCVRFNISGVTCQVFFFFLSEKVVALVGGGSVINRAFLATGELLLEDWFITKGPLIKLKLSRKKHLFSRKSLPYWRYQSFSSMAEGLIIFVS